MTNIRRKFQDRINTELEQSIIRFVIGLLVGAFFIFGFQPDRSPDDGVYVTVYTFLAVFFVCSSALVVANLLNQQASWPRRSLGILLDVTSISYCLYLGGEQSAFVFCLYLWILIGNGLRFGKIYLWATMSMSLLGFSTVVIFSEYWQQNISASIGIYFSIVALPLYFSRLLTRLQNANDELEHRVEQRTHELAVEKNRALASSQAKTQFLANMSHEFRTPLNAIIGYSEILIEDAKKHANICAIEDLQRIIASGQHLLVMIGDILDLNRIEAGKVYLLPKKFKLHIFLDDIIRSVSPMATKSGNKISLDPLLDNVEIESDETRLRQIVINLLSNAIKFTQNGSINISIATNRPDWIDLQVRDNGIGIAGEHLQNIFETFTQVDQSFTRYYGGSGLGLAICKRYSKLLGGEISVTSELNKGSTFTLSLPIKWQGSYVEPISTNAA